MAVDQKVIDVMEKVEKEIVDKGFFDAKDKFDQHVYSLLQPKEEEDKNYLLILKRFNSFTPALPRPHKKQKGEKEEKGKIEDIRGGGYYLRWRGKGIAIDPGFDFIQNLASAKLAIGDIDAVVLTHGHNDHYIDLDPILSLLYEFNDLIQNKAQGLNAFFMGYSEQAKGNHEQALEYFRNMLEINHSDRVGQIGVNFCLSQLGAKGEEVTDYDIRDLKREYENIEGLTPENLHKKIDLFLARSSQKTVDSFIPLNLDQIKNVYLLNPGSDKDCNEYNFHLHFIPAKHMDLYGRSHCIGLRFDLKGENSKTVLHLGITSDTGYYTRLEQINNRITYKNLSNEFIDCSLLVAHIGSMQRQEFKWLKDNKKDQNLKKYLYKKHLGILGLTKLISELNPEILELCIISEYGEEMKDCRIELTKILNNVFQEKPVFRTGDIGLKAKLNKPVQIYINDHPERPKDVNERYDNKGGIEYYK